MDYLAINKDHWNKSTETHWTSDFYNVKAWLAGDDNNIRSIERALLPADLSGLKLLHLQCHFGQDTLSLARMGAQVTGVDLSDRAIARAEELASMAQLSARFLCCDVYSLPDILAEAGTFDIVFTSYGTIGWLPDMDRWAAVVSHFLKPGGTFVFAEFHPFIWTLNHDRNGFEYSYFNRETIIEEAEHSYTDGHKEPSREIAWNHDQAEVLTALLDQGLQLEKFQEFDYSPWNCFHDLVEVGEHQYQFKGLEGMVPITYALRMRKMDNRRKG
ncbi:MAG: class I SAM-dependent methyltransferase [Bacteroidota bacterium]